MKTRNHSSRPNRQPAASRRVAGRSLLGSLAAATLVVFCSCQSLPPSPLGIAKATNSTKSVPAARGSRAAMGAVTDAIAGPRVPPPLPSPARPNRVPAASSPISLVSHSDEAPASRSRETQAAVVQPGFAGDACGCGMPIGQCFHGREVARRTRLDAVNEYLCNGGDQATRVAVHRDWTVVGLHAGDTVAHYDTVDGQVRISESNELCIYAPRFAAVRRVSGVLQHEQHQRGAGVELPIGLIESHEALTATTVLQPLQPQRNLAVRGTRRLRERNRTAALENVQAPLASTAGLLPFEDFLIIRSGQFDNSEKARLAARLAAAVTWSREEELQVLIDNETAVESANQVGAQAVYEFELPPGKPRVRVVKIASSGNARPGQRVDFTIRFDNVGDQLVGNVTIIDHLVSRLEYLPESQTSTLPAAFFTQENDSESLTLRWELAEPLQVGEGGVIRFQCLVR